MFSNATDNQLCNLFPFYRLNAGQLNKSKYMFHWDEQNAIINV